jgi:hypothetical protein
VRLIRALILMLALLAAAPALAQSAPAVVSAGPDSVSLTLYRGMGDSDFNLSWLEGYALVTEKRTVRIPAGRSVIRFEGVAGGIFPESLVISGLPSGVREKNLDADLLSPRSLYGRSLGRPVTLTHRNANGTMVSERAIIRSAPGGAAIFETRDGFIAASCTGNEAIAYDAVPDGLSAKPTLSIETDSPEAREVTLTLSYLAWGFDWQVNYVATMRPDGKSADLVAWVTLASGDVTSFADAETLLMAGKVNREESDDDDRDRFDTDQSLKFQCMATHVDRVIPLPGAPPPLYEPMQASMNLKRSSSSVVDAISAEDIGMLPEGLGDYKLFRVPERTTVASNSQKQVQMFARSAVPVQLVYRVRVDRDSTDVTDMLLRAENRERLGLGLPLPRGNLMLFEPVGERRLLVGEGRMLDLPIDQPIEIAIGQSDQVHADFQPALPKRGWEDRVLTVTNANPYPVRVEARINYRVYPQPKDPPRPLRGDAPLVYKYGKNGDAFWTVEVPANSTVSLRLRK